YYIYILSLHDALPILRENLPDTVYAGAPYMIRTNNGVYLISYQTTENRSSNWELSTMEVVISDKPYDFRNPTQPFDVPVNKEAKDRKSTRLNSSHVKI